MLGTRAGLRLAGPAGRLSGGVIAALIALPYGLAMASLMGLPPVLGVFTSILTAPVIALLGRNPVLIGGTASATVPFIALAVRNQGIGGAAKVSIVASVIMMAFCVMRLGRHVTRVPHAVVTGFSCGIGAMMLISQLDIIMGVDSPLTRSAGSTLGATRRAGGARLSDVREAPLLLGVMVMVVASLSSRWSPRAPAPLIGVALAVLAARLLGFHEREIGAMSWTVPPFAGFAWSPQDVFTVLPSAFALAFVSSVNILITSRVVEHFRGRHKRAQAHRCRCRTRRLWHRQYLRRDVRRADERGHPGAQPGSGALRRQHAALRTSRTPLVLGVILWLGSGVVSHIPLPALAGVTAWMGLCLLDWSAWRGCPR